MLWFKILIIYGCYAIIYLSHHFCQDFRKAGLGDLAQNLEVSVRCQLGLSRGLTEAGNPPPWWLTHMASKLTWVSWLLSRWISPRSCLCVLQCGGWFSPEQTIQEIKAETAVSLWHGLRSNTPYSLDLTDQQWLNMGEVYTRMWILGGHFRAYFVLFCCHLFT